MRLPARVPRKVTETDIVKASIGELDRIPGVRCARNNNIVLPDLRGIPIQAGLGDGSPDVVGIVTIGGVSTAIERLRAWSPIAFAFGIEFKKPGKVATRDQKAWHLVAARRGMRVEVITSVDDAVAFAVDFIRTLDERFT